MPAFVDHVEINFEAGLHFRDGKEEAIEMYRSSDWMAVLMGRLNILRYQI